MAYAIECTDEQARIEQRALLRGASPDQPPAMTLRAIKRQFCAVGLSRHIATLLTRTGFREIQEVAALPTNLLASALSHPPPATIRKIRAAIPFDDQAAARLLARDGWQIDVLGDLVLLDPLPVNGAH